MGPRHPGRLVFLDGWRGMAILLVLAGHFLASNQVVAQLANAGVTCFFVLSGRLMAEMLIVRRQSLVVFLPRRASRIMPALTVYVTVMLTFLMLGPMVAAPKDALIGAAGAIGLVHNYLPAAHVLVVYEHSWSIAVEEHAYLALGAVALASTRDRKAAMAMAGALAVAAVLNGLRLVGEPLGDGQSLYRRTDVAAAAILTGFALFLWAEAFFKRPRSGLWPGVSPICLAGGLALAIDPAVPGYLSHAAAVALLAIAVCTLDVAHPAVRRVFAMPGLILFGSLSYSIYLWQQPFYAMSHEGAPAWLCPPLALACAYWSFHRVERPARAWLNARLSPGRAG